ncbi:methionyl-tRNA formyltransferase [Tepidiphilus succinatimandens]|uniref:methionyl-tRNA formyltransferase n=1 Tax=Tepidiphilus succinatimandens TaxID=224436 RepID=UPI00112F23B9|nr:methionyl-tRNA formyltransferase [Tepidiphilus succinatimandens]
MVAEEVRRVAFAGTPEFAAVALRALLAAGWEVPFVLTQPDRPAGRGMKLTPSPVKQVAQAAGIAVLQPARLKSEEDRRELLALPAPDVLVVAAYGLILPSEVLHWPRWGCLNIHASLLPRWRGAAPIVRAIEAGDAETGVTLMQMDEGLDTGPMVASVATPIAPDDTAGSLHDRLAALGAELLVQVLPELPRHLAQARAQPAEGVTYAAKITPQERWIDWSQPAERIERRLRAFDPHPGAQALLRGVPLKLWRGQVLEGNGTEPPGTVTAVGTEGITVQTGQGRLLLTELQRPGGKRLPAAEFLRGFPVSIGERFTVEGG